MLLDLDVNGNLTIHLDAHLIPEVKKLIDRKKSKVSSIMELAFIYLYSSFKSPYAKLKEAERFENARRDAGLPEGWKPDDVVDAAMKGFERVQLANMPSLTMLRAAYISAKKLEDYFTNVDLDERDEKGKPIFPANSLVVVISKVGQVIAGLHELEEQVKKEQTNTEKIRGGGKVNPRER